MSPNNSYFDYAPIDNIHKWTLHEVGRQGMDAFFESLHQVLASLDEQVPFLIIIDISNSGFPALGSNIRRFASIVTKLGRKRVIRVLLIHNNSVMSNMAEALLRTFTFFTVRFVSPQDEEQGILWLRDD